MQLAGKSTLTAAVLSISLMALTATAQPQAASAPPFPQLDVVFANRQVHSTEFTTAGELLWMDGYGAHRRESDGSTTDLDPIHQLLLPNHHIAFSPNGDTAATVVGTSGIVLVDLRTGEQRELVADVPWEPPDNPEIIAYPPHGVGGLVFDLSGRYLAAPTNERGLTIYNLVRGTQRTLQVTASGPWALAPNGAAVALASGGGGSIVTHSWETAVRFTIPGHAYDVSFSHNGEHLAVTHSGGVSVIDAATGQTLRFLDQPEDGTIEHYDALGLFVGRVDGRVARLHDVFTETVVGRFESPAPISTVAFDVPNSRAALGLGQVGFVIAQHTEEQPAVPSSDNLAPVAPLFSDDGRSLVWGPSGDTLGVWDLEDRSLTGWLQGAPGPIAELRFSDDESRIAAVLEDATIRLWQRDTGEVVSDVASSPPGGGAAIGPDLSLVAINGATPHVGVFSLADEGLVATLHDAGDGDIAFTPSGDLIVTSWRSTQQGAAVWDINGQRLEDLPVDVGNMAAVRVSADGRRVIGRAVMGGGLFWSRGSGDKAQYWYWGDFSPDGTLVGTGPMLQRAESPSSAATIFLSGLTGFYTEVGVSPGGGRLAAVTQEGHCEIWSLDGPQLQLTLHTDATGDWAVRGRDRRITRGHLQRPGPASPERISLDLSRLPAQPESPPAEGSARTPVWWMLAIGVAVLFLIVIGIRRRGARS